MRRVFAYALAALLVLSLAGNGALAWMAWRSQQEYRALARQFVKAKQDLGKAQQDLTRARAQQPAADGTAKQAEAKPATAPAASAEAAKPASAAPARPPAAAGPSVTAEAVRSRYEPQFKAVQAECEGQLDALLSEAKAEYQKAKAANANIDVAALGAKYFARAEQLRRTCDRRVEGLLSQMGADLKSAGLPLDLVAEVRQAYEDRITERQAEIMAKAP